MGPPFWLDEYNNFHEPYDLACLLRHFWAEPLAEERTPRVVRTTLLGNWMAMREHLHGGPCGAKHPLLSLSLPELRDAWGPSLRVVWAQRSLEDSIDSLRRRNWFGEHTEGLQRRLWKALRREITGASLPHLPVDYTTMRRQPEETVDRLVDALGLEVDKERRRAAIDWVEPF